MEKTTPPNCHMTPRQRLRFVFVDSDMMSTRFWLAVGSIVWAALLLWPGRLFPSPEQLLVGCSAADGCRQTYAMMAYLASEEGWAAAFFFQGCVAIYTVLTGVRSRTTLAFDAFLGCILWTSTTLMCFFSHFKGWASYQPPAAMSADVMAALASWWHLIRFWAGYKK